MKIKEICDLLNAQVLSCEDMLDEEIESAFGSDLMLSLIHIWEAYQTVGGQNSNNSVRVNGEFMEKVANLDKDPNTTIAVSYTHLFSLFMG